MISRRAVLKACLGAAVGAAGGSGAYGFLYARNALALTETDVTVHGLPPALSGLRIGLLTDVHRSRWVSDEDVRDAVRLLMDTTPDLIVLGGDYVTFSDRRYIGPAAEALRGLDAPHGVFGILGNHDDDREVPAALTRQGIAMLLDARTRLTVRGEQLELAGLRFWTRRPRAINAVVQGAQAPVIMLAHDPRRLADAAALGVPLVLSGHTHGGQVVLPGIGAIAAKKFPVVAGVGQRGTTTLFVSRGMGTVYVPIRLNCPPEVAVVTLRPAVTPG